MYCDIKFTMSDKIHIPNISRYTFEIIDNTLILTPKDVFLTEDELDKTNLVKSSIISCIVKNGAVIISSTQKYRTILNDIWMNMPTQLILQNTTFNMKLTDEKGLNGYNWDSILKLSIQNKDSNGTMKEIIKMIKINNYNIFIHIKLEDGSEIKFKI